MITVKCRLPHTLSAVDYATDNDVIGSIFITNNADVEITNLSISIRCASDVLDFNDLDTYRISPCEILELKSQIILTPRYYILNREQSVELEITVFNSEKQIHKSKEIIRIFPYNYWSGEKVEQLCAFIFKDDAALRPVMTRTEYYLRQFTQDDKFSGYLYDVPTRPTNTFLAITKAVSELALNKVSLGELMASQCILMPGDIIERKKCTSLELALFLSSCLVRAKLHPLLCITKRTVLVGCWLMKKKLSAPIIKDKDDIDELVDVFGNRIIWCHLDNIFCNADYDINYGFVWSDDYLRRHVDEIEFIIDINAVRSDRGIYTLPLSAPQTTKSPDYQESVQSMTATGKVDYACAIQKYKSERRKYVSSLREDSIGLELLNEIYTRWCSETGSDGDAGIIRYLSDYPFRPNVLTADERDSLYAMRNRTVLRIIACLVTPNIKYGKFIKELVEIKRSDSLLIINDDTGGLISMIANDCKKMTVVSNSEESVAVFGVWKSLMQYEHIHVSACLPQSLTEGYEKIFVLVKHDSDPESVRVLLEDVHKFPHEEIIVSFSEKFFNTFCRETGVHRNILDNYQNYISNIYLIPAGIAERNDGRFLVRINVKVQGRIEMTNGLLIPGPSILNSFNLVKKEEQLDKKEVVTRLVDINDPEWARKMSYGQNPYNPITWTVRYREFCYLGDVVSVLSPAPEDWANINNSFVSSQSLLSPCQEVGKCYYNNPSSIEYETLDEYENIGAKYYKLTSPSIIIRSTGLDAYKWKSIGKVASDEHIFQYKVLVIGHASESKPLFVKDDGEILVFAPRIAEDLPNIVKFIREELFFAQQMDLYKKIYTVRQLPGYLFRIIVPRYLYDQEERLTVPQTMSKEDKMINKYIERSSQDKIPFEARVANVLVVGVSQGIVDDKQRITNIKALAELLVLLEYVRPDCSDGWQTICDQWVSNPPDMIKDKQPVEYVTKEKRRILRNRIMDEDLTVYKLKWKEFNNVFYKKSGAPISAAELSSSFRNSLKGVVGLRIVIRIMRRYNDTISSYPDIL